MWFPLVRRFTSAPSSSSAASGVTPIPEAEFSAFATTRSSPSRAMRRGARRCTAWRPGLPKTSPRKRTFTCPPGGPSAGLAGEEEDAGFRHDRVERRVVGLARELGNDLRVERDPEAERARHLLQRRVVVAATAPEAEAVPRECDARHDDTVHLLAGDLRGRGRRLERAERAANELARLRAREHEAAVAVHAARVDEPGRAGERAPRDLGRVHLGA